ncbi:hypothetical protein ANANG_G00250910 [Anguilla anguilla]|uniref:Uncharacterized protein n=1 Tax=Anguilla anguilla TaxID=7936 RepID=A0A9D3LTD6_ANGAN|nr:hypothetical protein ANANG_G00250910 [Anguilla anguilla]
MAPWFKIAPPSDSDEGLHSLNLGCCALLKTYIKMHGCVCEHRHRSNPLAKDKRIIRLKCTEKTDPSPFLRAVESRTERETEHGSVGKEGWWQAEMSERGRGVW